MHSHVIVHNYLHVDYHFLMSLDSTGRGVIFSTCYCQATSVWEEYNLKEAYEVVKFGSMSLRCAAKCQGQLCMTDCLEK